MQYKNKKILILITLDDNFTVVEAVQVRYSQTLSSSDHLDIEIYDDPENSLVLAIATA